jgi:hypothetical protein
MLYSDLAFNKMMGRGHLCFDVDDHIAFNILNCIRRMRLAGQDFYTASCDFRLCGRIELTFMKDRNSLVGYCRAEIKDQGRVVKYIFTEKGFELLHSGLTGSA